MGIMVSHSNFSTLRCSLKLDKITVKKSTYIYIYIAKRFSNPRKESTPCDGDGKRK